MYAGGCITQSTHACVESAPKGRLKASLNS